jgi:tetratricopeptide (TPR) repeat protein
MIKNCAPSAIPSDGDQKRLRRSARPVSQCLIIWARREVFRRHLLLRLLSWLLIVLFTTSAFAAVNYEVLDPAFDDYEGVDLVMALLRSGKVDEAQRTLNHLDQDSRRSSAFWLAQGDLHFQKNEFQKAHDGYQRSLALAEPSLKDPLLLKLAESDLKLSRFKSCTENYNHVRQPLTQAQCILKSICELKAGFSFQAWGTLRSLPPTLALERRKIEILLELGLFHEAHVRAEGLLPNLASTDSSRLALAELFQVAGRTKEAFALLELTRLLNPQSLDVLLAWAQVAHSQNLPMATAQAFSHAALIDPKYYYNASELFRQIGRPREAKYYAQFIPDSNQRLQSQIAMAVDEGNYSAIASLEGPISRSNLKANDDINYALAYSLTLRGATSKAMTYLDRITRSDVVNRAVSLRARVAATSVTTAQ